MGAAFLAGAIGLLALPTAIRHMSLRPRGAARMSLLSLVSASALLETGFVACAIALCAICTEALFGGKHNHFFPGGRIAGLVSLALAVAFPIALAIGLMRARWRTRTMHLEPWVGSHVRLMGFDVAVLPTPAVIAYSTATKSPQIVVSEGLLDTLSPAELEAVLAHEAAHLHLRHGRLLLPVAALEPIAAVAPPLRTSLAATRFTVERWADEQAIDFGGTRSSLISALQLVSTAPPMSPVTFLNAADVKERLHALEDRPQASLGQTVAVIGGLALLTLISLAALILWL